MNLPRQSLFLLALLSVGCIAAPGPDEPPFSGLADPTTRVAAQQQIFDQSRAYAKADEASKAWFAAVKAAWERQENPEAKAALAAVLALDPAVRPAVLHGKMPRNYPAPEGTTPETRLAEAERLLEQRKSFKDLPLSVAELTALARSEDFATAQRASRLLRRVNPTDAAPLLWERLSKVTQRSQAQEIEDEILRLPVKNAVRAAPVSPVGNSLASKSVWLRVVACRPGIKVDKASVLPLLKGPANELTEAAWDAMPRVFSPADLPQLQEAAQGLSERLAPRAKAALELVR